MRPAALLFVLVTLLPRPAGAQPGAQDLMAAVRAERWVEAETLAAALPDPLARKLVLFFRLLTPGAARAPELRAFTDANPGWPQPALLGRRLQEATAGLIDDAAVLAGCQQPPAAPPTAGFLLRCAAAALRAGRPADAVRDARAAWVGSVDTAGELPFLKAWSGVLTPGDQWLRFDRLAWSDTGQPGGPAARQAVRVGPADRPAAEARLALRRDDPAAAAIVRALSPAARADPALVLDLARWLRRANQDGAAIALWTSEGAAAEAAAPAERRTAFWDERNLMARRMLRLGDPAVAYALASGHRQANEAAADAEFLAGWIALRRLDQPALAARHFDTLAGLSRAAITQGRAHYWRGRAAAAMGAAAVAHAAYSAAAAWPTTYYGQLAIRALGSDDAHLAERLRAVQDPAWTVERAAAFTESELARAAVLLATWGEKRRARVFLHRLDETAADPAGRALAARLSLELGLPEQAVAIARRAGRDGLVLADTGWPAPVSPPDHAIEPAVALSLIRQESSFDVQAVSPAGARGLMQLMPATAASVARRREDPAGPALLFDGATNMRLGTAYLEELMERFDGALPLALAGYNAGPRRVQEWIAGYGDPLAGPVGMIDWIEMIPFSETRNYVQRVIEGIVVYRVRRGSIAPHPLARWAG